MRRDLPGTEYIPLKYTQFFKLLGELLPVGKRLSNGLMIKQIVTGIFFQAKLSA